jgi:hypothetical protein
VSGRDSAESGGPADAEGGGPADAEAGGPGAADGAVQVAAPQLAETARIWFDSDAEPAVVSDDGCTFVLVEDGGRGPGRLALLERTDAVRDPARVARVLAEGLAACDFPPNGDGASAHHVSAALRAHGLDPDDL